MRAARNGRTDVVVKLIKEGAGIDMQNVVCCLLLHLTLSMRSQMYGLIICHYTEWRYSFDISFWRTWD